MKVYTSAEIMSNVIDAAEREFGYSLTKKEIVEPMFRELLHFLRGLSLDKSYRWAVSRDEPIARARFVGEMIGKAYGNADSLSNDLLATVSGASLVNAFGFIIGKAVYLRCTKDIYMAQMAWTERCDAEGLDKELAEMREREETSSKEKEGE